MKNKGHLTKEYLICGGLVLLCFLMILLAPLLGKDCDFLRKAFALVCHQRQERSLNIFGQALICARCLGIYTGITLGLLWLKNLRPRFLILVSVLLGTDILLQFFLTTPNIIRFLLGTFWGIIFAPFLFQGLYELIIIIQDRVGTRRSMEDGGSQ